MFQPKRHVFRLATLVVIAGLAFSAAQPARTIRADDSGKPLADTGFRPDPNGFSFQNYGDDIKVVNLTSAEMRRLYGDGVCESAAQTDGSCILTPQAQQSMETTNKGMGGGHCEGMAVLSLVMNSGNEKATDFGADKTVDLTLDGNEKLQREIAYWFSIQETQQLQQETEEMLKNYPTSNEMVDALIKALADGKDTYTIGFWQPGYKGGHAVSAYAVVDKGDDTYWVMIYDNNFPKEERHFAFNRKTGEWSYFAAANPNEPGEEYKGDDSTKTFVFNPLSSRLAAPFTCPFCGNGSAKLNGLALAATQYNVIHMVSASKLNAADLLIEDADGHKLGFEKGKFFNDIPGAKFAPQTSSGLNDDSPEPLYYIPVGTTFSVTLDGSALKAQEIVRVAMIGPGHDMVIDNIKLQPGEADAMVFSPDGKTLSYKPSSSEAPDISIGVEQNGADYAFFVQGFDLDKDGIVNVKLDTDKGQLSVNTLGSTKPAVYGLEVQRIDKDTEQIFTHDGIELAVGATAYINYAKWDGKGDLTVEVDKDSNGQPDETLTEPNQKK